MSFAPPLEPPALTRESPWRDTLAVLIATALTLTLSARFNWSEALYALTRQQERLQLDELPIGMLVLLTGILWLAWRRNRQALHEIRARRAAEMQLEEALAANRALAQETLRSQEADRKHLALELHDELGQYLNAIKLDAVSIHDGHNTVDLSNAIIRSVDHLSVVVNHMIGRLRPVALDELGLPAAIEHSVDQWRHRLPDTQFAFQTQGNFEGLDETLCLTAYRLIQEGVTNVYKHAKASRVEISLTRPFEGTSSELCVLVIDDGVGADLLACSGGHGLTGMRERVEHAGGALVVTSAPGCGLRIEARLPICAAHA